MPENSDVIGRPSGFSPITPNRPTPVNPRVPSVDDVPDSPVKKRPNPPSSNTPSTPPVQGATVGRLLFDKFNNNETKFTSLRFSSDSFNGATSTEPLIQKSISFPRLGRIANPRVVAKENEERVSLLFNTTGRGYRFIQNQKNLTYSNSRLESVGNQSSKLRFTSLSFYDPKLTLAQIGRDPLEQGEHYTRFGISPFMDDSLKYTGVVTKNNGTNTNRLSKLTKDLKLDFEVEQDRLVWQDKDRRTIRGTAVTDLTSGLRGISQGIGDFANAVTGITNVLGGNTRITNITNRIATVSRAVTNFLTPTIDQYQGGPGSVNAIGTTTIRRFDYTNNYAKTKVLKLLAQNKIYTSNYAKKPLPSKPENKVSDEQYKKIQQLEKTKYTKLEKTLDVGTAGYYYKVSSQSPTSTSAAKDRNQNNINWTRNDGLGVTGALSNFISSANNIKNGKLKNVYDDNGIEDISDKSDRMPIIFKIVDPFTGDVSETFKFSAYLNGFKDTSSPNHTEISYIGRSDYFYVFNKFKREVSFNFQIPCYNLADLRSKHRSLAALYSSTMGKYKNNKLGGILYQLTIGNYLPNEAGIITNMSYDIPNDTSWDIDEQLAHNLNVSISYTVIHTYLPQYDNDGDNLFSIGKNFLNKTTQKFNPKHPTVATSINQPVVDSQSKLNAQTTKASQNPKTVPLKTTPSRTRSGGGMLGGANQ